MIDTVRSAVPCARPSSEAERGCRCRAGSRGPAITRATSAPQPSPSPSPRRPGLIRFSFHVSRLEKLDPKWQKPAEPRNAPPAAPATRLALGLHAYSRAGDGRRAARVTVLTTVSVHVARSRRIDGGARSDAVGRVSLSEARGPECRKTDQRTRVTPARPTVHIQELQGTAARELSVPTRSTEAKEFPARPTIKLLRVASNQLSCRLN